MTTIKEIAKKAGVSPSTVSRTLRGQGRISPKTRERILRIAKELGYSPNVSARALVTGRTGTIGFLVHRRQSLAPRSFYGEILSGVEREASKGGWHLLFASEDFKEVPLMVKEKRVDGLLLAGCDISPDLLRSLQDLNIPLVLVDYHYDKIDSVVTDNVGGACEAVNHLINLGHKPVGFIAERLDDLSFAERLEGYKLALQQNGLPYDETLVAEGVPGSEGGYVAMKRLLEKARPPAIFAANDAAAIGAIRAIKEAGLKVPDDIAVVGFDDGDTATHIEPPLTTMRVFREQMGMLAARRLLDLIKQPDQPPIQVRILTQLIVRKSCGAARKGRRR